MPARKNCSENLPHRRTVRRHEDGVDRHCRPRTPGWSGSPPVLAIAPMISARRRNLGDADSPLARSDGTAIRENQPVWCQDFQNDPLTAPWHERGARSGWRASASLPLHRNGAPLAFSPYMRVKSARLTKLCATCWLKWRRISALRSTTSTANRSASRRKKALARESHRNRVFLRNASDGVHILDVDGNVLEVSDSFCKMLGYSREELLGANVSLWDAQWSAEELKRIIAEQVAKGGHSVFENRHRHHDGRFLDVEITSQSLKLDGKPVLFKSARDITERIRAERELVESEARFRGLVEQSIAGIYIIQDDKFAYVNPRFAEIRGYGSADELIGRDPMRLVAEKDRSTVAENIRRLIEGETRASGFNFTGLRKDGSRSRSV